MQIKLFSPLPFGGSVEIATEAEKGAAAQEDALLQLAFWQSFPALCPFEGCGAELKLFHSASKDGQFHYYGLRCTSEPAHETNFGKRKDNSSLFYKGAASFKLEYNARMERDEGNEQPPGDDEGWPPPAPAPPPKPQNAAQSYDQASARERQAQALATGGFVKRVDDHYTVRMGQRDFTIARDKKRGQVFCSCEQDDCVHKLAVKKYVVIQQAEAQAEASM